VKDAKAAGVKDAAGYAQAITTFLALTLDRCADFNCGLSTWKASGQQQMHLFTRAAIPMSWDIAEADLLGEKAICWHNAVDITAEAVDVISIGKSPVGCGLQVDAADGAKGKGSLLVSTDPPYYDNIGYAALSDFFYVWLRRTVGQLYPELFSTVLVPKMPELTASPERFDGDKEQAREHFESGFRKAFTALRERLDLRFPLTVYYAFKQEDTEEDGDDEAGNGANAVDLTTGWETLLDVLIYTDGGNAMRTKTGYYYLEVGISQVFVKGEWRTYKNEDEAFAMAGIASLPDPRMRMLETIRPMERAELVRWLVRELIPDEFQDELLQALDV
jgi:putative DNA methylase